jgi:hypothetical protein
MPDRARKAEILLNIVGVLALVFWLAGAGVIIGWMIYHPPVTVHGSKTPGPKE